MNEEIRKKLDDAIVQCLDNVSENPVGSKEREKEVELLDGLYKLKLEEDKLEAENRKAKEQLEVDVKKAEEQKKINWANIALQGGTTVAMIVAYSVWQGIGYRFEENGSVRNPFLRNIIGKILPKIK